MKKIGRVQGTAFHEAAHTVVAHLLEVPFRSVSIREDADSLGRVTCYKMPSYVDDTNPRYSAERARRWHERRVQVSLAGQIAERILSGRHPQRYSHASDTDHAYENALRVCGSSEGASAWLTWLFIKTRNLLENPYYWSAVKALASQLIEKEVLHSRQAKSAMIAAFQNFISARAAQRNRTPNPD